MLFIFICLKFSTGIIDKTNKLNYSFTVNTTNLFKAKSSNMNNYIDSGSNLINLDIFHADLYVSAKGNDNNSGTNILNPLATLTKALDLISNNETIGILNGTYTLIDTINITKNINIKGQSKANTIIQNSISSTIFEINGYDVNFENLTIDGLSKPTYGLYIESSSKVNMNNSIIKNVSVGVDNSGTFNITDCNLDCSSSQINNYGSSILTATKCNFGKGSNYTILNFNTTNYPELHCNTYSYKNLYQCNEGSCP